MLYHTHLLLLVPFIPLQGKIPYGIIFLPHKEPSLFPVGQFPTYEKYITFKGYFGCVWHSIQIYSLSPSISKYAL